LPAPPDVVVDVRRRTVPAGGGACGHSPICLIVLPALLYSALFPEEYDEATVTTKGVVTFTGSFTTDGEFIQARVREGDTVRDLRRLDLDELGRRVVVEVARGRPDALVPTPVLPQVDLLADYDLQLRHSDDGDRRGRLIAEAYRWLGDEAADWTVAKVADPGEHDAAKAAVLASACAAPTAPARARLLEAARTKPGPLAAHAALACFSGTLADGAADPFLRALADDVCHTDGDPCWADERLFGAVPTEGVERARAHAALTLFRCEDPARRVLLQQRVGLPRARAEVAAGLLSTGNACLATRLDGDEPEERAGMFLALADEDELGGAILPRLEASEAPPSAPEMATIARVYLRERTLDFASDRRGVALRLLHRGGRNAGGEARAVLAAAPGDPATDIGRVVLGDVDRALPAARALSMVLDARDLAYNTGEEGLVVEGLRLVGCDDAGIVAMAERARKEKGAVGPGCAR
ncbi:MAG: hypothetical protein ACOZNI_31505, partial [Myxococcota bacterium]